MKTCAKCGKKKPASEFHRHNKRADGLDPRCKDCVNTRPRTINQTRLNRTRARHRAAQDLIERHRAEFDQLYDQRLAEVEREATQLEAALPAEHQHDGATKEPVRLRRGTRREGQTAVDRIDVARCTHCVKHHDRGHRCPKCGAKPGAPERRSPIRRVGDGIDLAAVAEFNAGTERARSAARSAT